MGVLEVDDALGVGPIAELGVCSPIWIGPRHSGLGRHRSGGR
jgi:hypothetical protein